MTDECIRKLNNPDSCFLREIFNASIGSPQNLLKSVDFKRKYSKNIFKYGTATVYEYEFTGVAECFPHFMFIMVKDFDKKPYGDRKGYVISGDGLIWLELKDIQCSTPVYVGRIRLEKEYLIPLYFEDQRFIPVGHFKLGNW